VPETLLDFIDETPDCVDALVTGVDRHSPAPRGPSSIDGERDVTGAEDALAQNATMRVHQRE